MPINLPMLGQEETQAALGVLKSGSLTSPARSGGRHVQEFEQAVSTFTGAKFAVAVNSGTAALQAAIYAMGISNGDEVLVPSFTFVATANAVKAAGARPVFVDILEEDYTMDPADLESKVTAKSRAIIPVHLYGRAARMSQMLETASKHGLQVIEDAAQSLGTALDGRQTGTIGDAGCFSFYPGKIVTTGEGGIVTTNDKGLHDKLLMARNHGMVKGYDTQAFGLNLRMPEINAAIGTVQMSRLGGFISSRKKNAARLAELLGKDSLHLPVPRAGEEPNWLLYTISLGRRDEALEELNKAGIGAAVYYRLPVHKTPYYMTNDALPKTDWAASSVLSLPVHPKVNPEDLEAMAKILSNYSA